MKMVQSVEITSHANKNIGDLFSGSCGGPEHYISQAAAAQLSPHNREGTRAHERDGE